MKARDAVVSTGRAVGTIAVWIGAFVLVASAAVAVFGVLLAGGAAVDRATATARPTEAEKAAAAELAARKAAVEACVEARYKLVPGLLPSPLVKAQIEADCTKALSP